MKQNEANNLFKAAEAQMRNRQSTIITIDP